MKVVSRLKMSTDENHDIVQFLSKFPQIHFNIQKL